MALVSSPEAYARLAAGGLLILLALWLLYLNFNHRANRALALFLVLAGGGYISYTLGAHGGQPALQDYWFRVHPYFTLPLVFVVARFASVFPARRIVARPGAGYILLALGVAAVAAYAFDHALFWRVDHEADGGAFVTDYGPLYHFVNLGLFLTYALVALLFARDMTRLPAGPMRRQVRLICLGATLYLLWLATTRLLNGLSRPDELVAGLVILLPILLLVGLLSLRGLTSPDDELRRLIRRFLHVLPLPIITGVAAFLLDQGGILVSPVRFHAIFDGVWIMVFPVLVAYALLQHQLFDIDLRLKRTIRNSTTGGIILAAAFVVSQLAENGLSLAFGWAYGSIAAALLLLAIFPLQRVGERMAAWAMPDVTGTHEYLAFRKLEVYQSALEGLWHDGQLTPKERMALEQLRSKLGIREADATVMERDVLDAYRRRQAAV
jgi:hypothetical protein